MKIFYLASAHDSQTDHGITAELHIDPADHPFVGNEAKFFFSFSDPDGKFELKNCNCRLTVSKDGATVDQKDVQVSGSPFASLGSHPLYTKIFSDPGQYHLDLEGSPKTGSDFDSFDLHYEFTVSPTKPTGAEWEQKLAGS